jgi:hypothetical protein
MSRPGFGPGGIETGSSLHGRGPHWKLSHPGSGPVRRPSDLKHAAPAILSALATPRSTPPGRHPPVRVARIPHRL